MALERLVRCEGIPTGVHVVFEHDASVLLMRRAGTGFFDGLYSLPGGHVEAGEAIWQTAIREMREELGVRLEPDALSCLGVIHRLSDTNRIDFFMAARRWQETPRIAEPDKCDDLAWFPYAALPDKMVPYIQTALQHRAASPWILELGWT